MMGEGIKYSVVLTVIGIFALAALKGVIYQIWTIQEHKLSDSELESNW